MKWVLLVTAIAVGILTYYTGLRVGYVTLLPTYTYNARGVSNYTYRTYQDATRLTIVGTCSTRSGKVTVRFYDPEERYLGGQTCTQGRYGIALPANGKVGLYRLEVDFEHYTGRLEIDEKRD
ncbi:hypothetical protein [Deinococcus pimensis]|uniref:hypothetical protein n=1 Tax=Deinococcus pimensis TaxID=309888 RepID=UPI00048891A6|nr:hypothetical protein [Deinococcus pimensis]